MGDNNVKKLAGHTISVFRVVAGQLPEYQELSPILWSGIVFKMKNEKSNKAGKNTLEYGRHLIQDALETNWTTTRHAHLVLFKEIERGKCSWKHSNIIEKIRICSTAWVMNPKGTLPATKQGKWNTKDIICSDYNISSCKYSSDHIVEGQIHKYACAFCYQKVGKLYLHKQQVCLQQKSLAGQDVKSRIDQWLPDLARLTQIDLK